MRSAWHPKRDESCWVSCVYRQRYHPKPAAHTLPEPNIAIRSPPDAYKMRLKITAHAKRHSHNLQVSITTDACSTVVSHQQEDRGSLSSLRPRPFCRAALDICHAQLFGPRVCSLVRSRLVIRAVKSLSCAANEHS